MILTQIRKARDKFAVEHNLAPTRVRLTRSMIRAAIVQCAVRQRGEDEASFQKRLQDVLAAMERDGYRGTLYGMAIERDDTVSKPKVEQ